MRRALKPPPSGRVGGAQAGDILAYNGDYFGNVRIILYSR
jgi:hypothetical protein